MHNDYCRQVDKELIVEAYVAGKLKGAALIKFEEHLRHCEKHSQAVYIEKALKKGISEFARSEMKLKIQKRLEKQHEARFLLLRYAAILLVAVITPLLIYYQYNITPHLPPGIYSAEGERSGREVAGPEGEELADREKMIPPETSGQPAEKQVPLAKPVVPERKQLAAAKQEVKKPLIPPEPALSQTEPAAGPDLEADGMGAAARAKGKQTGGLLPGKTLMAPVSVSGVRNATESNKALEKELEKKVLDDSTHIKTCLEQHLTGKQIKDFQMTVRLDIDENGKVQVGEVVDTGQSSPALQECLVSLVNRWTVDQKIKQHVYFKIRYPQISAGH